MDVVDLREFYASPLGRTACRLIAARLQARSAPHPGATVLGFGYPVPYLSPPDSEAGQTLVFMLARQGVIRWPIEGPAATALVDELDLPLLESSVDVAVVIHALELSESPGDMLGELWRVLAPQGRLLLAVPHRRGLWARADSTPFGHGQPFSRTQLATLLKRCQFSPVGWNQALYMPPFARSLVVRSGPYWERLGSWLWAAFPGVIIVEAVKQVYAVPSAPKRARRLMPRFNTALKPQPALPFAFARPHSLVSPAPPGAGEA